MSYEQRKKHGILLEHMTLRTLAEMFNGDDFKTLILALVDFSENEEEATFPPDSPLGLLYKYEQVNHSNAKPLFRSRKGGFFAFQGARKIFSTFFEKHPQKSLPYSE